MQTSERRVVILGTGGTIAGLAAPVPAASAPAAAGLRAAVRHTGYDAAVLGVQALVDAVPALARWPLECRQLAQLDSCDMSFGLWTALLEALQHELDRPEVAGVVITHGTDTLEETAYWLHRLLPAPKPVVLTAAMRPADAPSPDGPQNLLDAVTLAAADGVCGVMAVLGGRVMQGDAVRKVHGYQVEAFHPGDAGWLARVEDGAVLPLRAWPRPALHPLASLTDLRWRDTPEDWPCVVVLTSHAGADERWLRQVLTAGVAGVVIAGTGNGSVHRRWRAALAEASAAGLAVVRASRCQLGGVVGDDHSPWPLPSAGRLTAVQARVELMLDLLHRRALDAPGATGPARAPA